MYKPDISVILSTHNRADMLRQTLEAMTRLDRSGLDVEFVVVDNNSKDDTDAVIDSFANRLPLTHLFEPRPGKNCALNRALSECELGEVVVFTDDDVSPDARWLEAIRDSMNRWLDTNVFGGKIIPELPLGEIPSWAKSDWIQGLVFSAHSPQPEEGPYVGDVLPFGPNMWVRRSVFDSGLRFNEMVGPKPENRIMGSETEFLLNLFRTGEKAVYVPSAVIVHRLAQAQVSKRSLYVRSYRWGRSLPYMLGPWRAAFEQRHPLAWRALCIIRLFYAGGTLLLNFLSPFSGRFNGRVLAIGMWAETLESWHLVNKEGGK